MHAVGEEPGQEEAVVAFLSDPNSFPHRPALVEVIETHMSRVFIAGDFVYKIKKRIRLDFVDFTSLEARRANCERELQLNGTLAPGIYREVMPLVRRSDRRLALGGPGEPLEWVLVMRRFERDLALDRLVLRGEVRPAQIDDLCAVLADFYRRTDRIATTGTEWASWWKAAVELNAASLSDPLFALPPALVDAVEAAERAFVERDADLLVARAEKKLILDGHGDLRPEHVLLGSPLMIVDRLEFDAHLRWTDPFDEAAFLGMECGRLGARWIAARLIQGLSEQLGERPSDRLLAFYAGHRAAMRARLSIEHMRGPQPRTPERWPRQACEYLAIAAMMLPAAQS